VADPRNKVNEIWSRLTSILDRKQLVILGPAGAGKTCLHEYLRHHQIPDPEYIATLHEKDVRRSLIRVQGAGGTIEFRRLKKGKDVPGNMKAASDSWKASLADADIVIFLFNASRLRSGDEAYGAEISDQCKTIALWLAEQERTSADDLPGLVVAGTHCDLDDDYRDATGGGSEHQRYEATVVLNPYLAAGLNSLGRVIDPRPKLFVGSLASNAAADELVARMFQDGTFAK
jgi:hypothetical protein